MAFLVFTSLHSSEMPKLKKQPDHPVRRFQYKLPSLSCQNQIRAPSAH